MESDNIFLVMSHPLEGREDDYRAWYMQHHLAHVVSVPGVLSGAFTTALMPDAKWRHVALYAQTGDPQTLVDDILRRSTQENWVVTDAINREKTAFLTAKAIGPRIHAPAPPKTDQPPTQFIVLTNCTEGDDDEFNLWYDERHILDVLSVPGMLSARRYALSSPTPFPAQPWRYAAIYQIAAEGTDETATELFARAGTMIMTPTLDPNSVYSTFNKIEAQIN